jgi:predicted nucleic acid-binding protein
VRRYLLDTTPLAAYFYGRPVAVGLISPWIDRREAATSILAYGELVEHLRGRPDFPAHLAELRQLLRQVPAYFLTYAILERYAEIRRALRPPGGPGLIGDLDTLIAATALERRLVVITTDADFGRVPGLRLHLVDRRSLEAH